MSTDKVTAMKNSLNRFSDSYKELKGIGLNQEILAAYLAYKTKLSMKSVLALLKSQEEFYDNLIMKEAVDKL